MTTRLHPAIGSIKRSYRAWVDRGSGLSGVPEEPAAGVSVPARPSGENTPPEWVANLIRRHSAARPERAEPAAGDLIVFSPAVRHGYSDGNDPDHGLDDGLDTRLDARLDNRLDNRLVNNDSEHMTDADDSLPLVMLLDEQHGGHWSGWLVGAHPDYAGSQDLVLDSSLLVGGCDPAPLTAMVQTWNRVHREIDSAVEVVHRLNAEAMDAVRALSVAGIEPGVAPAPGRMHLRRVAGRSVVTGTPYGKHDPRDGYLLLCRELADRFSQPRLERGDREHGDGEPDD